MHPNCVEYVNVIIKFAGEYIAKLLREVSKKYKYSSKEINEFLGVKSNGGGMWSIYSGNNSLRQVPTKEKWEKLKILFPELPEYKKFEEVFNITKGVYNIIKDIDFFIKKRVYPTQKPIELISYLIKTYSRENDLILDCFVGSGTTAVACEKLNRRWIGIELEEKYCEITKKRIEEVLKHRELV